MFVQYGETKRMKNINFYLKEVDNIFFDFDGVILDSNECKTDAFYKLYLKYGEKIANEVKIYHIRNGGISRFEKFRYWEKKYFNREIDDDALNKLVSEFSKLVKSNVISSNEIEGSINFIESNYKNYKMWIISGTPTDELQEICSKINLDGFFLGIHGSPEKKHYWSEKIISEHNLDRKKTLFIGDALADYNAAVYSKIKFLLVESKSNKNLFNKIKIQRIKNYK